MKRIWKFVFVGSFTVLLVFMAFQIVFFTQDAIDIVEKSRASSVTICEK